MLKRMPSVSSTALDRAILFSMVLVFQACQQTTSPPDPEVVYPPEPEFVDDFVRPFTLGDAGYQPRGEPAVSNEIEINGINVPVPISVTNGTYSVNNGEFTDKPGVVNNLDTVKVKLLAPTGFDETDELTLIIGEQSFDYSVHTLSKPQISDITLLNLIGANKDVSVSTSCDHCDQSSTLYKWYIEGMEGIQSYTDTLFIQEADLEKEISIEVTPVNRFGEEGETEVSIYRLNRVKHIFSRISAYAAVRSDGSVTTWGSGFTGYEQRHIEEPENIEDVVFIKGTNWAFAALKKDGSVISWGNNEYGGDSSAVTEELTGVVDIFATTGTFFALKQNGTVVSWGRLTSEDPRGPIILQPDEVSDIEEIFCATSACAAIKTNRRVATWGLYGFGGDSSGVSDQLINVTKIFKTESNFSALTVDGNVVTWGFYRTPPPTNAIENVVDITTTWDAYAALKTDGTVEAWGGFSCFSCGNEILPFDPTTMNDIRRIYSNDNAFAAIKLDGTVVTWGNVAMGADSSGVQEQLNNVVEIFSTESAFAALKRDGTVVTWGGDGGDSSSVDLSDIVTIYSNRYAFTAIKRDGGIVSWGDSRFGGDNSSVIGQFNSLKQVQSVWYGFAAITDNDEVISWGSNDVRHHSSDDLQPRNELIESSLSN